ncbi:MAG: DegT/DnrJ/EryC1/StrS family aminotransferase [Bacteroidia bacterium]|nr:DegT/DnrJ/EryC1/StrS family aminotransferase [Bacteroidia bacterium]
MKVPFSPPYLHPEVLDAVREVLESGWITTGKKTKELEEKLREYTCAKKVLCLNSATAGMELMLRWWGVGPGDEVIIPAYTYCATANVVMHCGAKPVMADIRPGDFTISPEEIEKKITPRTKAIITVDLGGMPCDYREIMEILKAKKHLFQPRNENQENLGRILLMADAAHSLGAVYLGKPAVFYTDVSVYSFHAVKNLTTAEGGAIALNLPDNFSHEEIYRFLYAFSLHGQSKDALAKLQLNAWEYDVTEAGFKCNMPDLLAAIGLIGIKDYEKVLAERKKVFDFYTAFLSQYKEMELPVYENNEKISSYHLYLLRIKGIRRAERDRIIENISLRGIAVNVHYKPLPLLSFYQNEGYSMADYPVSADCFEREITLPVFYGITGEQMKKVVDSLILSIS